MEIIPRFTFVHPGTMGVYGKSLSGKTTFVAKLILQRDVMYRLPDQQRFKSVWIFHGTASQPLYEILKQTDPSIVFYRGFPKVPMEEVIGVEQRPALVFIDDQEDLLNNGDDILKNLVTRDSHHLAMSVIITFQSLFPSGREAVNIQRQFDEYVFFAFLGVNNMKLKFEKLAGNGKVAGESVKVWTNWTKPRGGYMVLDLHPDKLEEHRPFVAWTSIFPDDQETGVRVVRKKETGGW